MKILIVENDESLTNSILNCFRGELFDCDFATSAKETLLRISKNKYDCFIVSTDIPEDSEFDILKEIKKQLHNPCCIIISSENSIDRKVHSLNIGADDYLSKPFALSELVARVNSMLRRYAPSENNEIVFNKIRINPNTFQVFVNEIEITLTKKEYELFTYFIINRNKVLPKQVILEHLWDDYRGSKGAFNMLYTHIKNLRKKIIGSGCNDYIQNINSMGYRFMVS